MPLQFKKSLFIDENENHHFDEKNELKIEYFPKIKRKVLYTPGIIKKNVFIMGPFSIEIIGLMKWIPNRHA